MTEQKSIQIKPEPGAPEGQEGNDETTIPAPHETPIDPQMSAPGEDIQVGEDNPPTPQEKAEGTPKPAPQE